MSVAGNETAALDEQTEGGAEFVEIGGRNHAADWVQVFGGEAGAVSIHVEPEEDTGGIANVCFGGV